MGLPIHGSFCNYGNAYQNYIGGGHSGVTLGCEKNERLNPNFIPGVRHYHVAATQSIGANQSIGFDVAQECITRQHYYSIHLLPYAISYNGRIGYRTTKNPTKHKEVMSCSH